MPLDRRIRAGAIVALIAYSAFVAAVGLWPSPVDKPLYPALLRLLAALQRFGVKPVDAYNVIEFTANVAFFVVPAVLLVLIVGRRRWWIAPLVGLACSIAIEVAQHFLLPARFATVADVIANTLGASIGTAIGVLALSRQRPARGRRRAVARDPRSS